MVVYLDVLFFLNFFVDFFLLLGTNRLAGYAPCWRRAAIAAFIGAVYGVAVLLPGFSFLGSTLWRSVVLVGMGFAAFGFRRNALRRTVLFYLLAMALGGIALGLGEGNALGLVGAAAGVAGLCLWGFRGYFGKQFVPVELSYGENRIAITALRDTGNRLRDPLTGQPVLILGPKAAVQLTGLSPELLRDPAAALTYVPGARLMPFRAVGKKNGLLLAVRLQNVKIGPWQGSYLVALAGEGLEETGEYQALTGGVL